MHPNDEISVIFERLSPPFLVIYYAFAFLFEEKSPKFASVTTRKWGLIARFCNAFSTKTPCIQHQNAVYLAPKRSVFCTKMQCNMHQNAVCFAAKRKVKCGKMQQKHIKYTILGGIYWHFDRFGRKSAWWRLPVHLLTFRTPNAC